MCVNNSYLGLGNSKEFGFVSIRGQNTTVADDDPDNEESASKVAEERKSPVLQHLED